MTAHELPAIRSAYLPRQDAYWLVLFPGRQPPKPDDVWVAHETDTHPGLSVSVHLDRCVTQVMIVGASRWLPPTAISGELHQLAARRYHEDDVLVLGLTPEAFVTGRQHEPLRFANGVQLEAVTNQAGRLVAVAVHDASTRILPEIWGERGEQL